MAKYRKKPIVVTAVRADIEQYITTLEGVTTAHRGDYIVTGVDNEQWAVRPTWFHGAYTHIKGDQYQRLPQVLEATQLTDPDLISTPTGDIKGDINDYKVTGTKGEQWFVKPDIFKKTYTRVGGTKMKNELQKAIDQIGYGAVRKAIPTRANIGRCDLHGAYMAMGEAGCCPICPPVPAPNGTTATEVEHYIDIRDSISSASGDNPGQVINPTGISEQDITNAYKDSKGL